MLPLRRSQRSQGYFCEEETRQALLASVRESALESCSEPENTRAEMRCFKRRKRGEPVQNVSADCETQQRKDKDSERLWIQPDIEIVGDGPECKVRRERSLSDLLETTEVQDTVNTSWTVTRKLQDVLDDTKPVTSTDEIGDSDVNDENAIVTPKPKKTLKRRSASRSAKRKKKKKDVIRSHFGIPEENSQEPACKPTANEEYLVVEDIDESPEIERKSVRYAYPSCDDPDAVEVNHSDVQCLEENEYINDTVVDVYIKFVQKAQLEAQDQIHVFNSFFYKKLAEAVVDKTSEKLEKLRKWMKGVNIFDKSYLLLPIHDRLHWSLAIVCFSGSKPGCHILHLDSMKTGHKSTVVYEVVRRYLLAEWKSQGGPASDVKKFHVKKVKVPQQDNEYDCGLYMLHFIQSFLLNAPSNFTNELPNNMYDWFSSLEASKLRESIRNILKGFLDAKKEESILENPNQAQASPNVFNLETPDGERNIT